MNRDRVIAGIITISLKVNWPQSCQLMPLRIYKTYQLIRLLEKTNTLLFPVLFHNLKFKIFNLNQSNSVAIKYIWGRNCIFIYNVGKQALTLLIFFKHLYNLCSYTNLGVTYRNGRLVMQENNVYINILIIRSIMR